MSNTHTGKHATRNQAHHTFSDTQHILRNTFNTAYTQTGTHPLALYAFHIPTQKTNVSHDEFAFIHLTESKNRFLEVAH